MRFGAFVDPQVRDLGRDPGWPLARRVPSGRSRTPCRVQREAALRHGDDTLLMARYVWALVHGVATLGIDGRSRAGGRRRADALRLRPAAHRTLATTDHRARTDPMAVAPKR